MKIAVTFARKASFLMLDEPFSGLDPMVRDSIVRGLARFIDLETQTLIITTHEIKDIEPLLDEVIVIRSGKVIARSEVDEIRQSYGLDVSDWMKRLYREEL
ncbi:AAA family ATPase [Thalassobacillus hwangdonensis]|uniref:AAA family ATPase n=1 Tax=Thalassobacillus hwangdonensis TaxID=546108 RepID=A0ABW3L440_9BACI